MLKNKIDKEKHLTICLVIPSLQAGGMERVMNELAAFFSRETGVDTHLVLYGKERNIFYDLPGNVKVHKPEWPFDNRRRMWSTIRTLLFLRRKIKTIQPDSILSFGEYWNSFVLLSLLGLKFPVYISDRCSPHEGLGHLHEFLRKILYPGAAGIIAQTSKAKQIYTDKKLNNNIRVIGNPIRQILKRDSNKSRENIVLSVGRLIDTKHHDRLIDIFQKANPGGWKLVIVGGNAIKQDGMNRLKNIIKQKGLQDQVVLPGTVSNVEEYYLKSKIFAFTSSSEGFPNVVGEAMSAGLPVISYDCVAGPSEMIENEKTGYLLELFDDETFKERLEHLMNDEELRESMGSLSIERVKRFSANYIGEKFYEFIT